MSVRLLRLWSGSRGSGLTLDPRGADYIEPVRGRFRFLGFMVRLAFALARRPRLVPTAGRQMVRLAPAGWWKRAPFLPLPAQDYMQFRLVTASGTADGPPDLDDTLHWLEWCRSFGSLPAR